MTEMQAIVLYSDSFQLSHIDLDSPGSVQIWMARSMEESRKQIQPDGIPVNHMWTMGKGRDL
jgi:hypothetical protein